MSNFANWAANNQELLAAAKQSAENNTGFKPFPQGTYNTVFDRVEFRENESQYQAHWRCVVDEEDSEQHGKTVYFFDTISDEKGAGVFFGRLIKMGVDANSIDLNNIESMMEELAKQNIRIALQVKHKVYKAKKEGDSDRVYAQVFFIRRLSNEEAGITFLKGDAVFHMDENMVQHEATFNKYLDDTDASITFSNGTKQGVPISSLTSRG